MINYVIWKNLSNNERNSLLQRPLRNNEKFLKVKIKKIINKVRIEGDEACKKLTKKYDKVTISDLQVSNEEFENARKKVQSSTYQAMKKVIANLTAYHSYQKIENYSIAVSPGIICESRSIPIERIGLYIPGGTAPLVSTALMLGVPSKIAACPVRILCTPPKHDGNIDSNIIVAAELCGIEKIYKLGGVQAIAAMAYGTDTIPKVDKIFGPGNAFVTQAKMIVAQDVDGAAYDLPAGPSEVLIISDSKANPEFIAADLLAQAEHGSDSHVLLISTDINICHRVKEALQRQIQCLTRQSIIEDVLKHSRMIIVDTIKEALKISNSYAPEHLILQVEEPRKYLNKIKSAGSIFLGKWSPVTAGDYASGTNHVLPTNSYAKKISGLSVRDFMKNISIQELNAKGLSNLQDTIKCLTAIEGLEAHQNAVTVRMRSNIND